MTNQKQNLRELNAAFSAKQREGRALIRPVSQVAFRLKPVAGQDRFATTVDTILRWMKPRAGRDLPPEAWERKSFELSDIGAQRIAAVGLLEPQYWAARLDDADKNVPLRTWVTEIGVGVDPNGDVLFGARLVCTTRGEDSPFDRSIPSFVKKILASGPAELDGEPIFFSDPRVLTSEADVDQLVQLLESPSRGCEVVVFALPEGSDDPAKAAASAWDVYRSVQGAAHIFVLSGPASFMLTNRVGRELSVFRQGIRTYKPGFKSWIDQPSNHPLALPQRVASWADEGPKAFERWLVNQVLGDSVYAPGRDLHVPGFNFVRQRAAQVERERLKQTGASDLELMAMYEQENEDLRRELKEQKDQYDGLLVTADLEREEAILEANAAKAQAYDRLYRIRTLEGKLTAIEDYQPTPVPDTLDGFEQWCKDHMVGAVELTNKALQGIRKSEFHDPSFIYKSLLLLRDQYVPMRVEGGKERRAEYENALAVLKLEDSATGDGIKFDEALYSVQYGGKRRALDRHLKGNDSRQRQFGFRLYFFWDDEGEVVVVGWLPSHLDNRSS